MDTAIEVSYHRSFKKEFSKLRPGEQRRFGERLELFIFAPYSPLLNRHRLTGRWEGYQSINIGGDLRAIFKEINSEHVEFVTIGTHSQLYT